ncbi:hypothetical protein QWY84_05480 [Aquisalimonas lutea]|uniref:hypothetical protein n=1 Tax=Aquisalimonas lutea TaxID=1327750 RepID=UPI0025B50D5F|nr:hypothetical protein [Aquisalimonas lutea]MDN3517055.1 hypothetical protein [Aquisalimonas lutea]
MSQQEQLDADLREMTELIAESVITRMDAVGVEIAGIEYDRHGPALADMIRHHFALPQDEAEVVARYAVALIAFRAAERGNAPRMMPGGTA